jgi:LysM repeat protein
MRQFANRSLGLIFTLFLISILVSGCFQSAGASLDATQVPAVTQPPPQPTTDPNQPPTVDPNQPPTTDPNQPPTTDPNQPPTTDPNTQPTLDPGVQPTTDPGQTQPNIEQTNAAQMAAQQTAIAQANIDQTNIAQATTIALQVSVDQTSTALAAPQIQPTAIPLPTETPVVVAQDVTPGQGGPFQGGPQATQTSVQQTLFAQATQILAGVTQTAAANETLTATSQGTYVPPEPTIPGGPTAPALATPTPGGPLGAVTGTPQGTPGEPGSGAAGPITGDCVYTVVAGDRLYRIGLRFNTTDREIARVNGIVNANLIVAGQQLRIPNCNVIPTAVVSATPTLGTGGAATPIPAGSRIHTVAQGETLFRIATQYNVTVAAIAQANGLTNTSLIFVGQQLVIP